MTEIPAVAFPVAVAGDTSDHKPPSFDVPSNKYADIFGLWPPELFDGFDEFCQGKPRALRRPKGASAMVVNRDRVAR